MQASICFIQLLQCNLKIKETAHLEKSWSTEWSLTDDLTCVKALTNLYYMFFVPKSYSSKVNKSVSLLVCRYSLKSIDPVLMAPTCVFLASKVEV